MPLKLAITALSVYLDKYFRHSKGRENCCPLNPLPKDRADTEMR